MHLIIESKQVWNKHCILTITRYCVWSSRVVAPCIWYMHLIIESKPVWKKHCILTTARYCVWSFSHTILPSSRVVPCIWYMHLIIESKPVWKKHCILTTARYCVWSFSRQIDVWIHLKAAVVFNLSIITLWLQTGAISINTIRNIMFVGLFVYLFVLIVCLDNVNFSEKKCKFPASLYANIILKWVYNLVTLLYKKLSLGTPFFNFFKLNR